MNKKSLRKIPVSALLLVLIIALSFNSYAKPAPKNQKLSIVTIDYPPLLGNKGTIMTDITTAAFNAQGITVTYKTYPLARVIRSVTSKSVPAALGSRNWFYKENPNDSALFIRIYWLNMHFFYLKSRFPNGLVYEKLSDLQNYKIGYVRGGALLPIFEKENITPSLVATLGQNVGKIYTGRDDMFAATELGGWAIINKYYPDDVDNFSASEKVISHMSADIIFASNQLSLYKKYKEGLAIIKENGTYLKIVENYYGKKNVPDYILEIIKNP